MADLKTNYVDDVLDTTKNQLRKYQQIQNDDGTVSFVDVTEYTQVGTSFGAKDINDTNAAINDVNGKLEQVDSNIADTGWQSVTFNSEYQKNIGSISSITNGKITNYKQIKSVDLITTHHINVNVASNNNLYLYPSNSSEFTGTFEYRLRIHY